MPPLAERMRPVSLDTFVGQEHLVGPNGALHQVLQTDNTPSMIFWGPPGVGKTTLANVIAHQTKRPFFTLSAINAGVKDIREVIGKAGKQTFFDRPSPILFIDEIHRFSKSQQDALLGAVEKGTITLIGATTENPSFEVISALLSRCQVYTLSHLDQEQLKGMVQTALERDIELKNREIEIKEWEALLRFSGGDARKLYNVLELIVNAQEAGKPILLNNALVEKTIQLNLSLYDKAGEQHYDIISAYIKSIRGSDPDGALYWLARMIEGGEDIKFIGRRLIISAAEDIGLANPNALLMANTCFQAIQVIGLPEARIILSEATVYLACSPKSNSAYAAIKKAQGAVRQQGNLSVPLHLRNAPTGLMKELGYGKKYQYAHDAPGNFSKQDYLPEDLKDRRFYFPQENPAEKGMMQRLISWWGTRFSKK